MLGTATDAGRGKVLACGWANPMEGPRWQWYRVGILKQTNIIILVMRFMDLYGILPFKSHWILPFIFMIFIMLPQNLTCLPWKSMVASDVFPIDAVPFSYWSGPYTLSSHSSMVQWKFEGLFTPNKQGRNPYKTRGPPHLGNMVDM